MYVCIYTRVSTPSESCSMEESRPLDNPWFDWKDLLLEEQVQVPGINLHDLTCLEPILTAKACQTRGQTFIPWGIWVCTDVNVYICTYLCVRIIICVHTYIIPYANALLHSCPQKTNIYIDFWQIALNRHICI